MNLAKLLILPGKIFFKIGINGYIRFLDDETYLRLMYWCRFHRKLNLKNPVTFNEKLQWLKLHNRRPEYTEMVDKYLAKKYVAERIGEEYIIPTLGVYDKFDEIDFNALPDQFVLKCTHDSGGLVICQDKAKLDIAAAKRKIEKCLKRNYYYAGREWPYKNVKPRIIAEEYLQEVDSEDVNDYKIHCFNGVPKLILVCSNRFSAKGLCEDFYTNDWHHINVKRPDHPNGEVLKKPAELDKMLELSGMLAKEIPFLRVDFYISNHRVYFGELTFYPAGGFSRFVPECFDKKFGDWLEI